MLAVSLSLTAASSFFQSSLHSKQLIYLGFLRDHLVIIARSPMGFCPKYLLTSYHNIPIRFDPQPFCYEQAVPSVAFFCRHDMPRKRKAAQSSETCGMETSATSGCVLQSHKKQMTFLFTALSIGKNPPMTTSMSTPSKANAQQLLARISPDVFVVHWIVSNNELRQPHSW